MAPFEIWGNMDFPCLGAFKIQWSLYCAYYIIVHTSYMISLIPRSSLVVRMPLLPTPYNLDVGSCRLHLPQMTHWMP